MLHCTKTTHLQTAVQLRWIWVAISSLVVYSTDWWYSSSTFDHWDFLLINRNNIIIDKLLPLTKQENHYLMQFRLKLLLNIPGYFLINIMSLYANVSTNYLHLMYYPIFYSYRKYCSKWYRTVYTWCQLADMTLDWYLKNR